jgi:hypothetical protein
MKRRAAQKRDNNQPAILPLLRFLPIFEMSSFGTIATPAGQMPFANLSPEVRRFVQALYDHGWIPDFDWSAWQEEAESYVNFPDKIRNADISTLQKLLTTHARKDRFCEGHLLEMLMAGHITLILRRLKSITESNRSGWGGPSCMTAPASTTAQGSRQSA